MSQVSKEIIFIQTVNLVLVVVTAVAFFMYPKIACRVAFLAGTVLLAFLLIAPRLLKMQLLKRWAELFLRVARNSKWMGIWTAVWFGLHGLLAVISMQPLNPPQMVLGAVCLLILLVLLALSNQWSYQHVTWWKHINMLVWMLPPLLLGYTLLAQSSYVLALPLITANVLLPVMILIGLGSVFMQPRDYFAALRLKMLAVGTAISAAVMWIYLP